MKETQTSGIGLGGLLGVVFITLKLCHVIDWSWWWVTAPLWAPIAIALAVMGGILAFSGLLFLVAWLLTLRK